jgi:hypothetical protein
MAKKGGVFLSSEPIRFDTKLEALKQAELIQEEFDLDCDPVRVYVLDEDMIPIEAAGRPKFSSSQPN